VIALLAPILQALWRPLAALLGGLGLYLKGRADAAQHARTEAMARDLHARETAQDVANTVAREPDPIGRLRTDWQRPEPVRPVAPDPDRRGG
jgi:hypothetical protein